MTPLHIQTGYLIIYMLVLHTEYKALSISTRMNTLTLVNTYFTMHVFINGSMEKLIQ